MTSWWTDLIEEREHACGVSLDEIQTALVILVLDKRPFQPFSNILFLSWRGYFHQKTYIYLQRPEVLHSLKSIHTFHKMFQEMKLSQHVKLNSRSTLHVELWDNGRQSAAAISHWRSWYKAAPGCWVGSTQTRRHPADLDTSEKGQPSIPHSGHYIKRMCCVFK